MIEIRPEEKEALKSAYALFEGNENDATVKALVARVPAIFGWSHELAKMRVQELLWEIGLLLGRGIRLSWDIFLRHATSVHEKGFIAVSSRP